MSRVRVRVRVRVRDRDRDRGRAMYCTHARYGKPVGRVLPQRSLSAPPASG